MQMEEFQQAIAFKGDIVVIHLGVNDTDPRDWPNYRDEFIPDYMALIDSFRVARPGCRILIAKMSPLGVHHWRFESGTRDWHAEIQLAIEQIAKNSQVELIDFHTPLYFYPNLIQDNIHPVKEGLGILANYVKEMLENKDGRKAATERAFENKVMEILKEKVTVTDKTVSFEDFNKFFQN